MFLLKVCTFAVSLLYGLKDLLTVDLCSVYLLSGVDIVIRYIEVLNFTFTGLCSLYLLLLLSSGRRILFFISRTSLNRCSLNRGSTVFDWTIQTVK